MKKSALYFKGEHNFILFGTDLKKEKNTILEIKKISLKIKNNEIIFRIEATFFLRKMVRSIMGFLIEVGKHKLEPLNVQEILKKRKNY